MKKTNTILITGGAGFVGSYLVKKISKTGTQIVVVDNLFTGKKETLLDSNNIKFFNVDISQGKDLEKIFSQNKIDAVIHLAAIHYIPYCNSHIEETAVVNLSGTYNVLNSMIKYGVKRIVFSSSAAVYKPSTTPHCETDLLEPVDIYGATKLIGEHMIESYSRIFNLDHTILRFFNVCGGGDFVPHLIPEMVKQAKEIGTIMIGNTASRRDYIRKEDVVRAIQMCLENRKSIGKTYNIGSGSTLSVKQLINLLKKRFHGKLKILVDENRKRLVDPSVLQANSQRILKDIGWEPKLSLEDYINNI